MKDRPIPIYAEILAIGARRGDDDPVIEHRGRVFVHTFTHVAPVLGRPDGGLVIPPASGERIRKPVTGTIRGKAIVLREIDG